VPHAQSHRGAHPEDPKLFAAAALPRLRAAAEQIAWLLDRGYRLETAIGFVGARHQLDARQRLALQRGCCSAAQYRRRAARELDPCDAAWRPLLLDGFNLVITLEVALSGGVLLECLDGAVRDIAGLRGSYRMVEETDVALDLVGSALGELRPSRALFLLDRPVSSSGRLCARILERAATWAVPVGVELVPDPDAILARSHGVVTSDSAVLDRCASWLNLARRVVDAIPHAWRVRLQ
jgi:hypothetical protein